MCEVLLLSLPFFGRGVYKEHDGMTYGIRDWEGGVFPPW